MLKGFKEFVLRGNAVDLAVGAMIGGMFGTVVTSIVKGVVEPLIAAIVGNPNFDEAIKIGPMKVGMVLTALVNFTLGAAVIYFLIVTPMQRLLAATKKAEPEAEPAGPTTQEKLLMEIRDALQKKGA